MPSPGYFVISKRKAYFTLIVFSAIVILASWRTLFPPDSFRSLDSIRLSRVQHKQFVNETVVLDGKDFENCSFVGVTLEFRGVEGFVLDNNNFSGAIKFSFRDKATRAAVAAVIQLMGNGNMITNGAVGALGDHSVVIMHKP